MTKFILIKYYLIILLIIFLQFVGCTSSTSPQAVIGHNKNYLIGPKANIFTILPKISYEQKDTGQEIPLIKIDRSDELGKWVNRISKEEIKRKGLLISKDIKDETKNQNNLLFESIKLKEISDQLVRPNPKDSYLNTMDGICNDKDIASILLQYLRVKVGKDDEWAVVGPVPLYFGLAPKVKQSTSFLKSVIRECGTGKILWENECFIRGFPNKENKNFENTIRSHFLNLSIK